MEANGLVSDWSSPPRCLHSDISLDTPGPGNTPRSDDCDSPPDLRRRGRQGGREGEDMEI